MANDGKYDYTDENAYEVYTLAESDALTNALRALVRFRSFHGPYWPRRIIVHKDSKRALFFGEDIILKHEEWVKRCAYYMSTHLPLYDAHEGTKTPTKFDGDRTPIIDYNKRHRKHKDY